MAENLILEASVFLLADLMIKTGRNGVLIILAVNLKVILSRLWTGFH